MLRWLHLGFGFLFASGALSSADSDGILSSRYIRDIRYLTSPSLNGRGTGTPGLDKAAKYISREFAKARLHPLEPGGFFQKFPVAVRSTLGKGSVFTFQLAPSPAETLPPSDFLPFNFSGEGDVSAPVVFAGYGITALEYGYDDYKGIDARGKLVVVLRHEPQEYDSTSVFEGRIYTEHSQWFSKAWNARVHGAAALVVITDTYNHATDNLEPFFSLVGPGDPGIPVVQIKAEIAERWFKAAGKDFKAVQGEIDRDCHPQSFAFPPALTASVSVHVHHVFRNVQNVVGYLPGETAEYVVIGAHYDHLGHGEQYSLAPSMIGQTHPGADDNASGTAGLLALARRFSALPKMKRGLVFVAFAGEELGLLGSSYYVNHPLLPIENAALMINMDMIGRIREGKVMVTGGTVGSDIRATLESLQAKHGLKLQLDDGGVYGSSDHTSFTTKLVPILFFFSGLHADYHRPSDTWDKIAADDAVRLLDLIVDLTRHVAGESRRPQFVKSLVGTQPSKNTEESLGGGDK